MAVPKEMLATGPETHQKGPVRQWLTTTKMHNVWCDAFSYPGISGERERKRERERERERERFQSFPTKIPIGRERERERARAREREMDR